MVVSNGLVEPPGSQQGGMRETREVLARILDQARRSSRLDPESMESSLAALGRHFDRTDPWSQLAAASPHGHQQGRELLGQVRAGLEAFQLTGDRQWLTAASLAARACFDLAEAVHGNDHQVSSIPEHSWSGG